MDPLLAELPPSFGYMLLGVLILWPCFVLFISLIPGWLFAVVLESSLAETQENAIGRTEFWFSASLFCAEVIGFLWILAWIPSPGRSSVGFGLIQLFTIFYVFLCLIWICVLFRRPQFSWLHGAILSGPFLIAAFCVELFAFSLKLH